MADLHFVVVIVPKAIIEIPAGDANVMEGWFSRRELEVRGFKIRENYPLWGDGEWLIREMVPMYAGCLVDAVNGWKAAMAARK